MIKTLISSWSAWVKNPAASCNYSFPLEIQTLGRSSERRNSWIPAHHRETLIEFLALGLSHTLFLSLFLFARGGRVEREKEKLKIGDQINRMSVFKIHENAYDKKLHGFQNSFLKRNLS